MVGDWLDELGHDEEADGDEEPIEIRIRRVGETKGHLAVQDRHYASQIVGDGEMDKEMRVGMQVLQTAFGLLVLVAVIGYEVYNYVQGLPFSWLSVGILGLFGLFFIRYTYSFVITKKRVGGAPEIAVEPSDAGGVLRCSVEFPLSVASTQVNSVKAMLRVYDVHVYAVNRGDGTSEARKVMDELHFSKTELLASDSDTNHFAGELEVPSGVSASVTGQDHFIVWQLDVHVDIPRCPDWHETIPLWADEYSDSIEPERAERESGPIFSS